jgi:hypothetical protein
MIEAAKRLYTTDELRFEIPTGFVDKTMNILGNADAKKPAVSLTIARQPRTEEVFATEVAQIFTQLKDKVGMKIIGRREREAGAVTCWEGRAHGMQGKTPVYTRMLFVPYYDSFLTFNVAAPRSASDLCDRVAEDLSESLRLRRR